MERVSQRALLWFSRRELRFLFRKIQVSEALVAQQTVACLHVHSMCVSDQQGLSFMFKWKSKAITPPEPSGAGENHHTASAAPRRSVRLKERTTVLRGSSDGVPAIPGLRSKDSAGTTATKRGTSSTGSKGTKDGKEVDSSSSFATKPSRDFEDDYMLDEVIGSGAFSIVWKGVCNKSGKKVAVKRIDKRRLALTPKIARSIYSETDILRGCDHMNITRVLDVYDGDRFMNIVLELMTEGDLFEVVSKWDLPESDAKGVFRQVVHGLQYLHLRGIVHRDLKPENLLMNYQVDPRRGGSHKFYCVKIADFGMSRILGAGSTMGTYAGTPTYMAPEVVAAKLDPSATYSKAVDIWSLGVILYVLLTKSVPFVEGAWGKTQEQQIIEGLVSFPDRKWGKLSAAAKDLVNKMLTVDPAKRPTIDEVLGHPWMDKSGQKGSAGGAASQRRVASTVSGEKTVDLSDSSTRVSARKRSADTDSPPAKRRPTGASTPPRSIAGAMTPVSPSARPLCKYGVKCYRIRNPSHVTQFFHPHLMETVSRKLEQTTKPA